MSGWVSTSQEEEDSIPPACLHELLGTPLSAKWKASLPRLRTITSTEHLLWAWHFPWCLGYNSEETEYMPRDESLIKKKKTG